MPGALWWSYGEPLHASLDQPSHRALTHLRQPLGFKNAADVPLAGLCLPGKKHQENTDQENERGKLERKKLEGNGLHVFVLVFYGLACGLSTRHFDLWLRRAGVLLQHDLALHTRRDLHRVKTVYLNLLTTKT